MRRLPSLGTHHFDHALSSGWCWQRRVSSPLTIVKVMFRELCLLHLHFCEKLCSCLQLVWCKSLAPIEQEVITSLPFFSLRMVSAGSIHMCMVLAIVSAGDHPSSSMTASPRSIFVHTADVDGLSLWISFLTLSHSLLK